MKSLKEFIFEAEKNKTAIGHFNICDLVGLKAIFESARELKYPVIIGVSEGERDFIGVKQIAALIKSLREEYDFPIFLNADHTRSLEKIKQVVNAGFDSAIFDASEFSLEENIKKTKEAAEYVKSANPNFLIEGELGYIGSGSVLLKEIPVGAAVKPEDFTKPEQAARFVKETGVDLLAPAVGNIHGIIIARESIQAQSDADETQTNSVRNIIFNGVNSDNPALDIQRIKKIKSAVNIPLILHGGSGIKNEDFLLAIDAGISIIHINTEFRLAWRKGIEKALLEKSEEIAPYKLLSIVVEEIKNIAKQRLKLFNKRI